MYIGTNYSIYYTTYIYTYKIFAITLTEYKNTYYS